MERGDAQTRIDLARLRRLLGTPEATWLVERVRRRLELGQALDGSVTLANAGDEERAAAERLLGRAPRPGRSLSVPLPGVDRVLRTSGTCPDGLAAAVVALTGPVTPRSEAADLLSRAWDKATAPVVELVAHRPELADWYTALQASGLIRRLLGTPQEAAPVLLRLAHVLADLPLKVPQSLFAYAATCAGDSHALDDGPLATLVIGAAVALGGSPPGSGAAWRREVWASVGLLQDELSSQVLALNLPGDEGTATGRALAALAAVGQPAVLTLRQLSRDAPHLSSGGTVHVCENPAVMLTAADRLGPDCPPLVCLQGQPSTAALHLLRLLTEGGATLRYHGDFDWGGLRIATRLLDHVAWTPWRYTTVHLRAALTAHPTSAPLRGTAAASPWDPPLADLLRQEGRRIEEEMVLPLLLDDLASASGQPASRL